MLRDAVMALGVLMCWMILDPVSPATAQQTGKVYRIGVLGTTPSAQYARRMEVFQQALQELGWVNGRNVTFDERWADGRLERLPKLAGELVDLRVDVILTSGGTPAVEAALKATRTIPIVFATIGDPVAQKIVQSMAHPGGNATGLTNMSTELYTKRLALIREAVPGITRVALVMNGANSYEAGALASSQTTSALLGIQLQAFDTRAPEDFEKAFDSMSAAGIQAVLVAQDSMLEQNMRQLGGLALKHRLPLVTSLPETGVLLAYDRDAEANYRRAATYVDKILKGAKPGDLPVEQPTKFALTVNLKTAKALGLKIPQSILLRADEVID